MSELVQTFLTNYLPVISVLIGFIATGFGILSKMKNILAKSNVENVIDNFKASSEDFKQDVEKLADLTKQLMLENAELKKQNKEILNQLYRIKE